MREHVIILEKRSALLAENIHAERRCCDQDSFWASAWEKSRRKAYERRLLELSTVPPHVHTCSKTKERETIHFHLEHVIIVSKNTPRLSTFAGA